MQRVYKNSASSIKLSDGQLVTRLLWLLYVGLNLLFSTIG